MAEATMAPEAQMIVTLEIPAETRQRIERDRKRLGAANVKAAMAKALNAAVATGADEIRQQLLMGELGLTMQNPGSGLAASLMGWMLDESAPLAALGVPGNSPAAAYARIHEYGGTITPKRARALAVPVSEEAKQYTSPRDMANLTLIPRKKKPPLLVEMLTARGGRRAQWRVHWVLLASVTITGQHWLSRGADAARDAMASAFSDEFAKVLRN